MLVKCQKTSVCIDVQTHKHTNLYAQIEYNIASMPSTHIYALYLNCIDMYLAINCLCSSYWELFWLLLLLFLSMNVDFLPSFVAHLHIAQHKYKGFLIRRCCDQLNDKRTHTHKKKNLLHLI